MTRMRQLVLGGIAALAIGSLRNSAIAAQWLPEPAYRRNHRSAARRLAAARLVYRPRDGISRHARPGLARSSNRRRAAVAGHRASASRCSMCRDGTSSAPATAMSVVFAFYENSTCARRSRLLAARSPAPEMPAVLPPLRPRIRPSLQLTCRGIWAAAGSWRAALNFMAPIGTEVPAGGANPDYWTVEPALAISYLANNWVIAGNFFYDINSVSSGRMDRPHFSCRNYDTSGQTF